MQPSLTTQVLELLLEKMSRDVPFKESRAFLLGSSPHRVATLLPLVVSGSSKGNKLPTPQGGLGSRRHLAAAWGLQGCRRRPRLVKPGRCRPPREPVSHFILWKK